MIRIHLPSRWLGVASLVAVGLAPACTTTQTGSANGEEATARATNAEKATQPIEGGAPKPFEHAFGPEQMLRDALAQAKLSAEQQNTIDAALAAASQHAPRPGEGGVMKPFFTLMADEVRSGKIDEAALEAKLTELKQAAPERHAGMAQALQTVHDTLSADQRAVVVSSIQEKLAAHEALEGKEGDEKHHEHGGPHGLGPLHRLLHGVDLADGQLDKIKSALEAAGLEKDHEAMEGKRAEMKTRMAAMLEAFKADTFDAKAALPDRGEMAGDHLQHMVKAMGVIVPLLDETQRAALAKNIEAMPEHPMWRGHREGAPAEGRE